MSIGTCFLQHGCAGEPMRTESTHIKERGWPHVGGYLVYYWNRWRVLHVQLNRLYIVCEGKRITVIYEGI